MAHIDPSRSSSTSPPLAPRGLRIRDAAAYVGCTNWHMETLVRDGKIPAHKIGHSYVIFIEDLDAYIDKLRKRGAA
jgi:excisionase family DNA binding protein